MCVYLCVCVCARARTCMHVYKFRTVSMDEILHLKNTFIVIIIGVGVMKVCVIAKLHQKVNVSTQYLLNIVVRVHVI